MGHGAPKKPTAATIGFFLSASSFARRPNTERSLDPAGGPRPGQALVVNSSLNDIERATRRSNLCHWACNATGARCSSREGQDGSLKIARETLTNPGSAIPVENCGEALLPSKRKRFNLITIAKSRLYHLFHISPVTSKGGPQFLTTPPSGTVNHYPVENI